ncbi:hypothetical protein BS78_01G009700 [Paspalum vaginatum]|nr:hypothetical protein BS78_01G009700 [Paspalum vaginatum]
MPPPQLPSSDHARPRPWPGQSSVVPAAKRPPPTSAAAASVPTMNTQRPPSALTAPSVSAAPRMPPASAKLSSPPDRKQLDARRPTPSQPQRHGAPSSAASLRPPERKQLDARPAALQRHAAHSTPAAKGGGAHPRRRPAPSSSEAFMAPRGVQTVRPARRLAPGTAVYVRTTFRPRNIKCRILLWLSARVVSSPDAFHCTVKYAADLNDMFAGRVVSMPVEHVRVAPRRSPPNKQAADPRKMAPAVMSHTHRN